MAGLIATLPLQLVCQLVSAGDFIPANCSFVADPEETLVLPDGYIPFPDIGMAYKYHPHKMTWNNARKYCIASEGNLAVIDSLRKLNHLKSIEKNPSGAGIFLGIHKLYGDGEWVNLKTGLPVGVIPWAPGALFEEAEHKNCMIVWGGGQGLGVSPCGAWQHHVCEIPIPVNKNQEGVFSNSQIIPN